MAPPNVGPEPPGLLASIQQKIFGQPAPPPADPYTLDDAACLKLLSDTRSYCEPGREQFEFGWWRNLLYLLGRQWIQWNPNTRQWQDKRVARWYPKPVTNLFRTTGLSIRATLADIKLSTNAKPNGEKPENVITAQVVSDLEEPLQIEHKIAPKMREADFWAIFLGNAYLHLTWDRTDPSQTGQVDIEQCTLCKAQLTPDQIVGAGQKCPQCGSSEFQPAMGPDGKPTQQTVVIGKGKTLVISPLELLLPLYATRFEDVDRLVYLTWRPEHEIADEYGDDMVKRISVDQGPQTRSLQMFRQLSTTSDFSPTQTVANTGGNVGQVKGCTEQHLWIKPCKKFPQGFYMRFLGEGNPVPIRPTDTPDQKPVLPNVDAQGRPLWPWIDYPYEPIEGRLYAQSAVDVIVQKQDQLNQIDANIQMSITRMSNPIWLEPKGSEVERYTGEPGVVVKWQPIGPSGAKPERLDGANVAQSSFVVRDQYKADAEELAGTYDVLKGQRPAGIEAFSALNLLVERSQSRFSGLFACRGEVYRQWYQLAIEFERVYGPTQRVKSVMGPNKSWIFQTFKKTDLMGDISIVIEDGGNVPKTSLARRAAIEHARQLGLILPGSSEQTYALYQEFGLQNLMPSLDTDVKSALQEQQAFEDWVTAGMQGGPPASPLQRLPWQNDQVHIQENRKWMNSDAVRELIKASGPAALALIQLLAHHLQAHTDAMLAVAPPVAGAGGPPKPPPGAGGPPPPGSGGHAGSPPPQGGAGAMQSSNTNSVQPPRPPGA